MLNRTLFGLTLALALVQASFGQAAPADQALPTVEPKHQKDIDADIEQGKKYVIEVEKQLKVSKNQEMQDRVTRVGAIMAHLANETKIDTIWGDKRFSKFDYT
ncbi:MAG: hypothetical protein QOJ65_486, partial [Fimbriimonadaceae bacterium]|nr:hypothetical protein [Fimbriimonadaceae bacterium]